MGSKKIKNEQQAKVWIAENHAKFELLWWAGDAKNKSRFKDKERNIDFECSFSVFRDQLRIKPNIKFGITAEERVEIQGITFDEAKEWLMTNFSHIEILEWGGSGVEISKFIDKNRNKEFKTRYSRVKNELQKNSNVCFAATKEENQKNKQETTYKNYGVKNGILLPKAKENRIKTFRERYGVDFPLQSKEIRNLAQDKLFEQTGVRFGLQDKDILEKTKQSYKDKYGVEFHSTNPDIVEAMIKTNMEKYGVPYAIGSKEVQEKSIQKRIETGHIRTIDGKRIKDFSIEKDVGITLLNNIYNLHGPEAVKDYEKNFYSTEGVIKRFLEENDIKFIHNKKLQGTEIRPDFVVVDNKLIIECDGLYHHSDVFITDQNFHIKRKSKFKELGYESLFFRQNELEKNKDIIFSIISNKLKLNKSKIGARKCEIKEVSPDVSKVFFETNHLMGNGAGKVYGLYHQNELVSAISVKLKNENDKLYEISRFCSKLDISVVGAFSKLLNFFVKTNSANSIITFIDKRYGDGSYLKELGFIESATYPSFKWIKNKLVLNRGSMKGNSGYDRGFHKLWDCGQTKWIKNI